MNNLFNFSRPLPVPFDGLTSKKVAVSSRYSEGTQATLCATVVKAILSVCRCRNGTGDGAVGMIDHRSVAEYKSSVGTGLYHLVVYDRISGAVLASVYNKDTELLETYTANGKGQDGAAIMMALMPVLMEDTEFQENFEKFYDQFIKGYPD